MTVSFDITMVSLLVGIVATAIGVLWKLFSFAKAIEDKMTKAEGNLINEELMELQHEVSSLKEAVAYKADKVSIELLKQDLEFVRKMMVTKEDLLQLQQVLKDLLQK